MCPMVRAKQFLLPTVPHPNQGNQQHHAAGQGRKQQWTMQTGVKQTWNKSWSCGCGTVVGYKGSGPSKRWFPVGCTW